MDESFLLMLSNLLLLQISFNPSTSLFSSTSATSLLSTSSISPLLFPILSLLPFLLRSNPRPAPSPPPTGAYTVAAFQSVAGDAQWRSLYGLSYPVFTKLIENLDPHIAPSDLPLPSDFAVAMVLFRLAHGHSAKSLASWYNLEPYSVSKITNIVTRLLATKLYKDYVKIPSSRPRLIETTEGFEELTSLHSLCGAIDGSPIKLRRKESSDRYRCRYGYSSVQLQVVSDHKKVFWDVCVKVPGAVDDATHLRESLLYKRLVSDDIGWEDNPFSIAGGHCVRPYLVGDWGYPLMSFLMTPFSADGSGTAAQNLFDEMLMKGRSVVVDAIGLLKGRWKILQDLDVGLNHAAQTIVACCVLHNLCQMMGEPELEPDAWREPDEVRAAPARVLDSEKTSHRYGDSLRRGLTDDLYHRLSLVNLKLYE